MNGASAFDRILTALGHPYRRRLLVALTRHNPQPVEGPLKFDAKLDTVNSLVTRGGTPEIMIVHSHLPKLADLGYIEWEDATSEISRGPKWGDIEPMLHLLLDHDDELGVEWL